MKAKGRSGSRLFSARLKCTRPTRFQAGFRLLRKLGRSVFAAPSAWLKAWPISCHSSPNRSGLMYSAPGIIGAVNTREANSASVGGGTSGIVALPGIPGDSRHRAPTYCAEKPRHQTKTGGSNCPTSPAPSCSNPRPVLSANALVNRMAARSSRPSRFAASSSTRRPCGVSRSPGTSRTAIAVFSCPISTTPAASHA